MRFPKCLVVASVVIYGALLGLGTALAVDVTINVTPPAADVVEVYFPPNATNTSHNPVQWIRDGGVEHQDLGQSFSVFFPPGTPAGASPLWQMTGFTVRVPVATPNVGASVAGQKFGVDIFECKDKNDFAPTKLKGALTGSYPGAIASPGATAPYWFWHYRFTAAEQAIIGKFGVSTKTPESLAVYAFVINFIEGPDPNRFIELLDVRSPDNYAYGRILIRNGIPPTYKTTAFQLPTDPRLDDLYFYIIGKFDDPIVPPPPVPPDPAPDPVIDVLNGGRNNVGGVAVDPAGILTNASRDETEQLRKMRTEGLKPVPAELKGKTELRKISLRALETAVEESAKTGQPLPDAVQYLAGLQRIRYVFAYPEQNDIVLAGPGEGWTVDNRGNVVGATTHRPVMLLDDLVVALRAAKQAALGGMTCSINPTPDGIAKLRAFMANVRTIGDPDATGQAVENALGMQQISVTGVPSTSHLARVLVAADYRMKRIAMGLDPSPVRTLPSFLQMLPAGGPQGMGNVLPRWWLEPKYESILHDGDRLAWELRGAAVKAKTEEDMLMANGTLARTANASPTARRWAELMTQKYDELAGVEPIFGELQNCMDLAIVASLLVREQLPSQANCNLRMLSESDGLPTARFPSPTLISSKASLVRKGRSWAVGVSGGVTIDANAIVAKAKESSAPADARAKAQRPDDKNLWRN